MRRRLLLALCVALVAVSFAAQLRKGHVPALKVYTGVPVEARAVPATGNSLRHLPVVEAAQPGRVAFRGGQPARFSRAGAVVTRVAATRDGAFATHGTGVDWKAMKSLKKGLGALKKASAVVGGNKGLMTKLSMGKSLLASLKSKISMGSLMSRLRKRSRVKKPKRCPGGSTPCSGHGSCNTKTGKCTCFPDWAGTACKDDPLASKSVSSDCANMTEPLNIACQRETQAGGSCDAYRLASDWLCQETCELIKGQKCALAARKAFCNDNAICVGLCYQMFNGVCEPETLLGTADAAGAGDGSGSTAPS